MQCTFKNTWTGEKAEMLWKSAKYRKVSVSKSHVVVPDQPSFTYHKRLSKRQMFNFKKHMVRMHFEQRVTAFITEVPCKIATYIQTVCVEIINTGFLLGCYDKVLLS